MTPGTLLPREKGRVNVERETNRGETTDGTVATLRLRRETARMMDIQRQRRRAEPGEAKSRYDDGDLSGFTA